MQTWHSLRRSSIPSFRVTCLTPIYALICPLTQRQDWPRSAQRLTCNRPPSRSLGLFSKTIRPCACLEMSRAINLTSPAYRTLPGRCWPSLWARNSANSLFLWRGELFSEDFTLRMSTKHVLSCPPCPACSGNIFFVYEDVYFTEAIDVMATGAVATIRTAIEEQLTPLQRWKDVNISVSYSQVDAICDTTDANTITIGKH